MAKNKKVFKSLAVAAIATSAIVPVASANTTTTYSDIVTSVNGQLTSITQEQYNLAVALGKNPTVEYVKVDNKFYSIAEYNLKVAIVGAAKAFEELTKTGTVAAITPSVGAVDGSGNITNNAPVTGDLKVESVSAINNNGVTVTFPALTSDITGATVTVKDPAGNTVAVVAQNLSKGATSATFSFTAPQASLAAGTWTVDGKSIQVKSQDAGLQNLVANVGVWSQDFAKDKLEGTGNYTINVENGVSNIDLTPTAAEGATVTASVSGTGLTTQTQVLTNNSANKVLLAPATTAASTTTVSITVVAPDQKTSKSYEVKIVRASANATNNAYATDIKVNSATPQGYKQDAYSYSTNVASNLESAPVAVTPADTASTVYINGNAVTLSSGTASKNVNLAYGKNTVTVKVVAPDNSTSKTYTVEVTRANPNGSIVNTLNSFTQSVGQVSGFTADVTNSALSTLVPNATTELTITPVATNAKATVFVSTSATGVTVEKQGSSYVIKGLVVGNNVVTVAVTSETGVTTSTTYTIKRATATANDVANLSVLEVGTPDLFATNQFKPTTTDYSFNVTNATATVGTVVANPATNGIVSYKVNGVDYASNSAAAAAPLKIGANVVEVKVTSENALNSRTYKVTINRADVSASTVKTLKSLTISAGTLQGFEADTTPAGTLTTAVANTVNDLTVTPVTTHAGAKVVVTATNASSANLTVEQSGSNYVVKGLTAGVNAVTISVTPEDASTAQVYTLNVTKAGVSANDNANLTSVAVDGTTLNYGASQTAATTNVTFATNTATIFATATDATNGATTVVKKGGKVVTGAQALAVGANNFEIEVTAADGKTVKTYTVTVNRAAETASKQAGLTVLTADKGTLIHGSKVEANVVGTATATADLHLAAAAENASVTFTATTVDADATVEVLNPTGATVPTISKNANGGFTIASLDNNDTFDVKVTSPDTAVTYTTTVTVKRAAAGDSAFATLTGLTEKFEKIVLPAGTFTETETLNTAANVTVAPATKAYEYFVTNDTSRVTFTKHSSDTNKTVTFVLNGVTYKDSAALPLSVGANVVTVNTLAADKVAKDSYTLTINRASSSAKTEAGVNLLTTTNTTITAGGAITVADNASYTFSATAKDTDATVTVSAKNSADTTVQVAKTADGKWVVDGQPTGTVTTVTVTGVAADKATKSVTTFTLGTTAVTSTGSATPLATATGSTTVTLATPVTGLAASDIVVKKGTATLVSGTDYVVSVGSTTAATIVFTGSAALTGTDVITVEVNKAGYTIAPVTVTNSIPVPVTSVTLDKSASTLAIAGTEQLTATVSPTAATTKTVAWTTSNSAIATVSNTGLVTAVAGGLATITATTTDGSKTATFVVTVTP